MIDLEGIPLPEGAPEPGTCVRIERPEPGFARIVLDPPHRDGYAVFDAPLLRDLDLAVTEIEGDRSIRGLVFTGRDPLSFAAGADIDTIAAIQDPKLAERFVREGQALFQRIYRLGRMAEGTVRTVAAVGGPVAGGACELALACDRIVLADHPRSRIGLPEVLLGIYPAWGGSQRLPRRIGVPAALSSILAGTLHRPRKALKLGLVDRLAKPEVIERVATDVAMSRERCAYRGRTFSSKVLVDWNPLATFTIGRMARRTVLQKTGGHMPAPLAVLPLVVDAPSTSLEDGLDREARGVLPLTSSPVAANLIGLHQASEDAKALGREDARDFQRAAVVGAGIMGGGIAGLMAERGLSVRLRDLDRKQLDAALADQQAVIGKKRKLRRMEAHEADAAIDRLEVTVDPVGFDGCDLAIEAVAERLNVKQAVLGEMAQLLPDDAVLATNTSSLSVDAIAAGLPGPERVVGMHFFNPVRRMPLVEIVRGSETSDETVARIAKLCVRLRKTPIVTADVPGFLVNRLLGPYMDEALRLVARGTDPRKVDDALVRFGMPMGPLALVDEVGLDIAAHAGAALFEGYGARMQPSDYLAPLIAEHELGKKTGRGIYLWSREEGRPKNVGVNPRLGSFPGADLADDEIVDRCVLAMVNEAARALDQEVVTSARVLDLGMVFGTGFAPFRGGPLRYADTRGLADVRARLEVLSTAAGCEVRERFEPARLLARLASENATFHD